MKQARVVMRDFIIDFLKKYWNEIDKEHYEISDTIFKELKTNDYTLDWLISEVLNKQLVSEKIEVERLTNVSDDYLYTIFQIGNKFIRETFFYHKGKETPNSIYEFVKKKKRKVIVEDWIV